MRMSKQGKVKVQIDNPSALYLANPKEIHTHEDASFIADGHLAIYDKDKQLVAYYPRFDRVTVE